MNVNGGRRSLHTAFVGTADHDLSTQRSYYDQRWAGIPADQLNLHERARREAIERTLRWLATEEAPPWSIAEVGCGRGWLAGLVLASYGDVFAIDLSPESIAKARDAFPAVRWEARNIFESPLTDSYDLVVSSEVIEHVPDQRKFIELLVAATRRRGWILLTTPNARTADTFHRRADVHAQPIENFLQPSELVELLAPTCDVRRLETFFFGAGDGVLGRLARARMVRRLTRWSRGRDPLSRLFSRREVGLYMLVLAQRREREAVTRVDETAS